MDNAGFGGVGSSETVTGPTDLAGRRRVSEIGTDVPFVTSVKWFVERVGMPRLFDWLIGLASIVLGFSSFLYSRQIEFYQVGQLAYWFTAFRLFWIAGGIGLLLSDIFQKTDAAYFWLNRFFRLALVGAYAASAAIFGLAGDYDGVLINGLFALAILIKLLFELESEFVYMFYIHGLLLGAGALLGIFPETANLLGGIGILSSRLSGYYWVLYVGIVSYVIASWWAYFSKKKLWRWVMAFSGVFLLVIAFAYAYLGYWSRSFFILLVGMIGPLIPFWESFKLAYTRDRTLVFKMFGTILLMFFLSVSYIGVIQNILLSDAIKKQADKAAYARLTLDSDIDRGVSSMKGLIGNVVFTKAVVGKDVESLVSFTKAIFQNNLDFSSVSVLDGTGRVLSSYPLSGIGEGWELGDREWFRQPRETGELYVAEVAEALSGVPGSNLVIALPIVDGSGAVVSVAAGFLNLEVLGDKLQELASPALDEYLIVSDLEGRLLMGPGRQAVTGPRTSGSFYEGWEGFTGYAVGYDESGVYSLLSFDKLKKIGWAVAVVHPYFASFTISQIGLVAVLIISVAATLVILVSFFFSKGLVGKPIE